MLAKGIHWRAGIVAVLVAASPLAGGCRSIVPLSASTRLGDRLAAEQVLMLGQACTLLPGATPMGRPDGARSHTLPSGPYRPVQQDDDGIYFASPGGIRVMEPAPRGTRTLPGGVYVAHEQMRAWEYLGDEAGIRSRQPLPGSCEFRLEPKPDEPAPVK
jgi:hypothetical protein